MKSLRKRHLHELIIVAYVCILIGAFLLAIDCETAAAIILFPGLLSSGAAFTKATKKDLTRPRDRVHL